MKIRTFLVAYSWIEFVIRPDESKYDQIEKTSWSKALIDPV